MKVGEFIYPWGGGHYARMMRLDAELAGLAGGEGLDVHYASKGRAYQRLLERFPDRKDRIHKVLMPTPIDGRMGPSLTKSLANVLLPVGGNPSLVRQVTNYLREERRLYDGVGRFDLVINDGDVGSNVLAANRGIPCLFVTNQFRPRLYRSRSYLYPAALFISRQIAKATKILVADSPPPHTICEYNLNFADREEAGGQVEYVGYFTDRAPERPAGRKKTDLERLLGAGGFGYWMRTGDKSTNDGTGKRYEEVFAREEMGSERRLVSHARDDPGIDSVTDRDKRRYTIAEAADRNVDWVQIDVGFLPEQDKDLVLDRCRYAVINGSHTVMGEIMGIKSKPVIGVPIYDEHTNNVKWADERGLGILAANAKQIVAAIKRIKGDQSGYADRLAEFSRNFDGRGAQRAARIAADILHR